MAYVQACAVLPWAQAFPSSQPSQRRCSRSLLCPLSLCFCWAPPPLEEPGFHAQRWYNRSERLHGLQAVPWPGGCLRRVCTSCAAPLPLLCCCPL